MKKLNVETVRHRYIRSMIVLLGFIFCTTYLSAQQVTGLVTDQENVPLTGVTVVLKGTVQGTVTDTDGKYHFKVSGPGPVLVFSYIGYKTQEIPVNSRSRIDVKLEEENKLLNEVVAVGFQSQKKVNLTGSVATVGSEQLEDRPVVNVGQALQGAVPNLNVSIDNGSPNTVPSFNLRGGTSIVSSSGSYTLESGSPLILIDGIEAGATNLNTLNPNDIDNISVIKDASASAIYGTRATYGVILVTTKSGSFNQAPKVHYGFELQLNTPSNIPDVLNSYEQQLANNNYSVYTGGTVSTEDEEILAAKKAYMEDPLNYPYWMYNSSGTITWLANVNPFKEAVKNWTPIMKHSVDISGGSSNVSYYISGAYTDQSGFLKINNDEMKRYNILANNNIKLSEKLSVGTKISFTRQNYDEPYIPSAKGTLWSAMLNEASRNINMPIRTSPTPVTDDPDERTDVWTDNILGYLADTDSWKKTTRETMYFNVAPAYQLIPEVTLKGEFSYRPRTESQKNLQGQHYYVNTTWSLAPYNESITLDEYETKTELYTVRAYADFKKTFLKKHTVSGIFGYDQESYKYRYTSISATGLLSLEVPVPNVSSQDQQDVSESLSEYSSRGVYGRINYNFADRYLFEMNGRYDGSSKFPKSDRFKFFPSFSAGWRISEEPFMEPARTWIDNLKLRASYGTIGSQPDDNYPTASTMSVGGSGWIYEGSELMEVSPSSDLVSDHLTWQKATTSNLGLDATLLKTKIDLSFDIYERRVTDILLDGASYPAVLGATAPLENTGEMKAYGWEFQISWRDQLSNGLKYGVTFSMADSQTEVVKYNLNTNNSYSSLYPGKKLGEMWGYTALGLMQDGDFDEDGTYLGPSQSTISSTWYPGDMIYADINGDGRIDNGDATRDDPGDVRIIGNSNPRYTYAVNLDAAWKGFDLSLFFNGVGKRDVYISNSAFWGSLSGAGSKYMYYHSWTPERTDAKYPMYGAGSKNYQGTGGLFNGTYLRLKQAVLGYTLPAWLSRKAGMEKVRFTLSGYNLFEITDIPDVFSPDQISSAYPNMRSVAFGAQVTF